MKATNQLDSLSPAIGSWVVHRSGDQPHTRPGQVMRVNRSPRGIHLTVRWLADQREDVVALDQVECGLRAGYDVWHVPESSHQQSMGGGSVIADRRLGGRRQLLVDFQEAGTRLWLPWERLRFAKGAGFRFKHGDPGGPDAAERFRMRNLACALELWNENTGALSHFDIDPLPHQIHLVHHILGSGNLNWLIADDVGLGKTIEAGLLIAALRQRGDAKRILIVVPAGLTRQWQEDLKVKFGLDDFLIYGSDFQVADSAHWKLYDRVIASLDRLKLDSHLSQILEADPWDLVIFDEAHRLSRRQWGLKFERSDRYRLAEALRERTRSLLMLTATPHQGRQDQFVALLELLRPELKDEFRNLDLDASVLERLVFRNRKSDVTDMNGNFVFHGQTSKMIQVDTSPELQEFERSLQAYLKQGYLAADRQGGQQGKAIGFVMMVYRKLAASSIVAIQHALARRLVRLKAAGADIALKDAGLDERYFGEWEESFEAVRDEFFSGEIERLKQLIDESSEVAACDTKMAGFLDAIIGPILERSPEERVLVFSEYRGTQGYIINELSRRYGAEKVHVINGSMAVEERLQSIRKFEEHGQFLVSTEAGGEGINLHRKCHILVNYDLPWNPMRLAQRIGRLYRYGQTQHVVAFNLQGIQSADEHIVAKMYERLEQVARDMAGVVGAGASDLVSEIVGELANLIDVEGILEDANVASVDRTSDRIEEALRRARESSELQQILFKHAASYDAAELNGSFQVGTPHLQAFVLGMVVLLGGEARDSKAFPGRAWRLVLPDTVLSKVKRTGRSPLVAFDRAATVAPEVELIDMDHALVRHFLELAKHYNFQGLTGRIAFDDATHVVTGMLRWQDDRGRRVRQEYVALSVDDEGAVQRNPSEFSSWLLQEAGLCEAMSSRETRSEVARAVDSAMDDALAGRSNLILHPENREWVSAAWCNRRNTQGD